MTVSAGAAQVSAGEGRADVWLIRYDPRLVNVPIRAGENGGRTLPHKNVVRQLIRLGTWTGKPERFAFPAAPDSRWKSAVLLQKGRGGPILAAGRG